MSASKRPFGAVLGERVLVPRDGSKGRLTVSLGTPRPMKDHPDWECPFRLRGLGINQVQLGYGVDGIQAVTNALQGIRYALDRLETRLVLDIGTTAQWKATPARWKKAHLEFGTGFHRFIPIGLGAFSGRLERLVDREMADFLKVLKRRHALREKRRRERTRREPGYGRRLAAEANSYIVP